MKGLAVTCPLAPEYVTPHIGFLFIAPRFPFLLNFRPGLSPSTCRTRSKTARWCDELQDRMPSDEKPAYTAYSPGTRIAHSTVSLASGISDRSFRQLTRPSIRTSTDVDTASAFAQKGTLKVTLVRKLDFCRLNQISPPEGTDLNSTMDLCSLQVALAIEALGTISSVGT